MYKFVFYIVFFAIFSCVSSDCKSGKLLKCDCVQKTDQFEQIPLFKIDCSRLNFNDIPSNTLPLYTGRLDVSHNEITTLNESSKIFSSTLNYFDLSYNKISSIPDKYFQNISRLLHLNLGHNQLKTLTKDSFYGLSNIKIINLQSNEINSLQEQIFSPLSTLEELILNNNNVGEYVQQQQLSNYLPKSIKSLHLNNIGLKNVTTNLFEDLQQLRKLSIAYNPFHELPDLKLNFLEYLDVSGTKIRNMTTKSLNYPYLKVLKMNRLPYITKIYNYAFFNLHKLEELYIEHCVSLEEMEPITFGYLQDKNSPNHLSLKKISVAYSGLKFLPDTFQFVFQNLEEIHLRGNFWDCSCKLTWFTHLKKNVKDVDEIRCSSPESHINKMIHNMSEEEFSCFQTKELTQPPQGAPKQTWLFSLIGALSIIILIFIGVLIYMGPYGQNIYKIEGKIIGPDSPYSPVTICPNKAEDIKL